MRQKRAAQLMLRQPGGSRWKHRQRLLGPVMHCPIPPNQQRQRPVLSLVRPPKGYPEESYSALPGQILRSHQPNPARLGVGRRSPLPTAAAVQGSTTPLVDFPVVVSGAMDRAVSVECFPSLGCRKSKALTLPTARPEMATATARETDHRRAAKWPSGRPNWPLTALPEAFPAVTSTTGGSRTAA